MASFASEESRSYHEQELIDYFIKEFMPPGATSIPGNEWMTKVSSDMANTLLYANGRFQGLVPGLSPEDGYGGHPGLIYKLIVCALCFGINKIGISVSKSVDNKKNPLTYEQKINLIDAIIKELEKNVVNNILASFLENEQVKKILEQRLVALRIHVEPLTNPFSMVLAFKKFFFNLHDVPKLIMATGLETKSDGTEYNKYAKTFDKLVGEQVLGEQEKPFSQVGFILTSRETGDTMSGTIIRDLISSSNYAKLAEFIKNADFTSEEFIQLYAQLIINVKRRTGHELSQGQEGDTDEEILAKYAAILEENIAKVGEKRARLESGGGSRTKKAKRTKKRKSKRRKSRRS